MQHRIRNRPLAGVLYILAIVGLVLVGIQIEREWGRDAEERARVERLEHLLWRQAGAGRIASALEQLEIAELTGAIEPERAEDIRKKLEHTRTELRKRIRGMAQELVKQKRERASNQERSEE